MELRSTVGDDSMKVFWRWSQICQNCTKSSDLGVVEYQEKLNIILNGEPVAVGKEMMVQLVSI